jgi:opacity protein-like surface antigen
MRTVILALATSGLVVMPAHAQEQRTVPQILPEVTVSPPVPKGADQKGAGSIGGAGVKNGDDHSFGDLNQKLKRKVDEVNPTANNPPLDASSPDTKTGVINIPGVQQQYGKNFGNSVIPYRPPPPVFGSPVGARR